MEFSPCKIIDKFEFKVVTTLTFPSCYDYTKTEELREYIEEYGF